MEARTGTWLHAQGDAVSAIDEAKQVLANRFEKAADQDSRWAHPTYVTGDVDPSVAFAVAAVSSYDFSDAFAVAADAAEETTPEEPREEVAP